MQLPTSLHPRLDRATQNDNPNQKVVQTPMSKPNTPSRLVWRLGPLTALALAVGAILAQVAAAAPKSAGGSGKVDKAGENAADLLSGIIGPVLLVLIGAISLTALVKREVGMAISAMMIGLVAGLFVFAPDSAENAFSGIYKAVF